MPRAKRACPTSGCPELTDGGRCPICIANAEAKRGTAAERGYGRAHRNRFRRGVLRRDPLCVCTEQGHKHGTRCLAPSTVADHYPRDKRQLIALGLDSNDPKYGRGLCAPCHGQHTSVAQPGGWNAR